MSEAYAGLVLTAIIVSGFGFFLYRNSWTYRVRTDILAADPLSYRKLPSYEAMMYRFWVWDAAWFIGRGEDADAREARELANRKQRGLKIIAKRQDSPR